MVEDKGSIEYLVVCPRRVRYYFTAMNEVCKNRIQSEVSKLGQLCRGALPDIAIDLSKESIQPI